MALKLRWLLLPLLCWHWTLRANVLPPVHVVDLLALAVLRSLELLIWLPRMLLLLKLALDVVPVDLQALATKRSLPPRLV